MLSISCFVEMDTKIISLNPASRRQKIYNNNLRKKTCRIKLVKNNQLLAKFKFKTKHVSLTIKLTVKQVLFAFVVINA